MEITFDDFQRMVNDNGDPTMATSLGNMAEKNHDLESAINYFTNAISYSETFTDAYFDRARCFTKLKKFDKAIEDYENLLTISTEKDLVKALIGNVYGETGNYEIALKYQNDAVEINPNRADNYFYRGLTKYKTNKIEGALFDFEYSLQINPNQSKVLFQIGQIQRQRKDYKSAFDAFNKLVLIDPNNGHSLYNRALVNFSLNKKEESFEDFLEAHKLGITNATQDIIALFIQNSLSMNLYESAFNLFDTLINTAKTIETKEDLIKLKNELAEMLKQL